MTRLKYIRHAMAYPDDVKKICYAVSEINSYMEAQFLWSEYSQVEWQKVWTDVNDETLTYFDKWLKEEIGDPSNKSK